MLDATRIQDPKLNDIFQFSLAFANSVLFLAPLIKSASFKEEKEWRLITTVLPYTGAKFRKGNYSIIPYWEFDIDLKDTLKTIIIGPTPEPKLSSTAVRGLLFQERYVNLANGTSSFGELKISQSNIPFRKI